jgi:hypothetical protein
MCLTSHCNIKTNSKVYSHSEMVIYYSGSQETSRMYRCIPYSPSMDPISTHMTPIRTFLSYLQKTHVNIIIPFMLDSPTPVLLSYSSTTDHFQRLTNSAITDKKQI